VQNNFNQIKMSTTQDYLIVSIVFGVLALLLLIHHRIKHNKDIHINRWFQIEDIYNKNMAHEKFIVVFGLIAIVFGVCSETM
jgi:hypothetical protein